MLELPVLPVEDVHMPGASVTLEASTKGENRTTNCSGSPTTIIFALYPIWLFLIFPAPRNRKCKAVSVRDPLVFGATWAKTSCQKILWKLSENSL